MSDAYFGAQPSPEELEERVKGFPSWLEIDLDNLRFNLEQIRERVGVEVIPCVKTNAYGHGVVPVAAFLEREGVGRVLVAKLWEAEQIRGAGSAWSAWIPCSGGSSTSGSSGTVWFRRFIPGTTAGE